MTCASCGTRKAKRACPALGRSICPTCCGTKRLKEIACPSDCVYLASAQAHPPAVVQRQRERDLPLLVHLLEGLSDPQAKALAHVQARLRAYRGTAIPALRDNDVAEAVHALAATLETAARGILYEHQTTSIPGQRLQQELRTALAELGEHDRALGPNAIATMLRRMEATIQRIARQPDATETSFLDFLDRVGGPEPQSHASAPEPASSSRIILP
jgi:hypothetical protein